MSTLDLRLFNSQLEVPADSSTISSILARQGTAFVQNAEPSPVLDGWDPAELMDKVSVPDIELSALLAPVREKIRTKWWGKQGQALPRDLASTLLDKYKCSNEIGRLSSLITPTGDLFLRHLVDRAKTVLRENGGTVQVPWNQAYTAIRSKDPSNSGFRGFSTALSRTPELLKPSFRVAGSGNFDEPFIMWYRHMRNKYRAVFGGSLVHLAKYEVYLSWLLNKSLFYIPSVAYTSEKVISQSVSEFTRKNAALVKAIECDYEAMDTCESESLACQTLELYCHYLGVSPLETQEAIELLTAYYHVPVVDYFGNVHYGESWSTLSGISPTNGIESLTNSFVQLIVLGRVLDANPSLSLLGFLLLVMGDDSALLMKSQETDRIVHLFLQEFEVVCDVLGLRIQRSKQAVSDRLFCFCRRYYPIGQIRRIKFYGGTNVPIPIYPIDYAVNSLRYPEDGPSSPSADHTPSYAELKRVLSVLDNACGDPLWVPFLNWLRTQVPSEQFIEAASSDAKNPSNWRRKVYGAESWAFSTSPTVRYLMDKA